jgi:hypothetical protein
MKMQIRSACDAAGLIGDGGFFTRWRRGRGLFLGGSRPSNEIGDTSSARSRRRAAAAAVVSHRFVLVDEFSPALRLILKQVRELNVALDKARANLATIGKGVTAGLGGAVGKRKRWRPHGATLPRRLRWRPAI